MPFTKPLTFLFIAMTAVLLSSCAQDARSLSLDKPLAKQSFVAFLESWKKGEQSAVLRERSPSITGVDPDWSAGTKLVDYRLLDTESDDGTNLHASAELVLLDPRGRERRQQITYIVGTSPVITVFRK